MPGPSIAFYGISSELAVIARAVGAEDSSYFIDEEAGLAYRSSDVGALGAGVGVGDSLMPLIPLDIALKSSDAVVFAPRYRDIEDGEGRMNELQEHLKSIAPSLMGKLFVNALPVGIGENEELAELLERWTGRRPRYAYLPVGPGGSTKYLGLLSEEDAPPGWLLGLARDGPSSLRDAEAMHIGDVLSGSIPGFIMESLGVGRSMYLKEMAGGLLEAFLVGASADPGSPMYSIYNFARRSFDDYMKRLVVALKSAIKEAGMKISRARIAVIWSLDQRSARGDEAWAFDRLREALAAAFVDVTFAQMPMNYAQLERRDFILVCSEEDYEALREVPERILGGKIVLRASLPEPETSVERR